MKLLHVAVTIGVLFSTALVHADSIFNEEWLVWKRIHNGPGKGSEQIAVASIGILSIMVERPDITRKPKPDWCLRGGYYFYDKYECFNTPGAKEKYADAMAAGAALLRSFPARSPDDDVTVIRFTSMVKHEGRLTKDRRIEIPEFYGEGNEDHNVGSENHKRFLAVKKILDDFDTDPFACCDDIGPGVRMSLGIPRVVYAPPGSATAGSKWIEFPVTLANRGPDEIWAFGHSEWFPFYSISTREPGQAIWRDFGVGFCGTGAGPYTIASGKSQAFTVSVPARYRGQEIRVTTTVFATEDGAHPRDAISQSVVVP